MDKIVYRFFLALCLVFTIYTLLSWKIEGRGDILLLLFLFLTILLLLFMMMERKKSYEIMRKQKEEITMYQLYTKPMEDLVKEIRAKQHEYDNHMNAILNMHLTISDYDELVRKQSQYIKEIYDDRTRQYYMLLHISDKVLAGFLYSKIVSAPEEITFDLHVEHREIFSKASEHDMIEVTGTLIDNAIEACMRQEDSTKRHIKIELGSKNDRMIFAIWNQQKHLTMEQMSRFFEKGYTTKGAAGIGTRGLGLYNAKRLTEHCRGSLETGMERLNGREYICFRVEM